MINEDDLLREVRHIDGRKLNAAKVAEIVEELKEIDQPLDLVGLPVKRGSWEPVPSTVYKCTACGGQFDFDDGKVSAYCPMCGARMADPAELAPFGDEK